MFVDMISPKIVALPAVTRPQELAHSRVRTSDLHSITAVQESTRMSTAIEYKAAAHRTTTIDVDRKMGISLQHHSETVL